MTKKQHIENAFKKLFDAIEILENVNLTEEQLQDVDKIGEDITMLHMSINAEN